MVVVKPARISSGSCSLDSIAIRTIWIINQDASTPETGRGGRHYYLARKLARAGHRVYLIAAGFTHLQRVQPTLESDIQIESVCENFDFVWIRMPKYAGSHDKKRVWNWISFNWKLRRLPSRIPYQPDAVIVSSPAPIMFLGAHRLARKFGARLAFEVRDLWPLTLIEIGGYSTSHPFIKFIQWLEDRAYRQSDLVLSVLPNALEHMQARGMDADKFVWIPNGFDYEEVSQSESLAPSTMQSLPRNKFIVGYAGALGLANSLSSFIEAAALAKEDDSIAWVIVGDGNQKQQLQKQVENFELTNVTFIDPIPKAQVQSLLTEFDICYIGLSRDPLFRFGVSPNKLFDYFYAAKPILYAIDSGSYRPVDEAGAGYSVPAQDPAAIFAAVRQFKSMPQEELEIMGKNGRSYAMKNHEYSKLAGKLADVLFD